MRRFIAFSFPEYETAWLVRCVKGHFDMLDGIGDDCKAAEGFEVLDTKTGDVYDWDAQLERWNKDYNVSNSNGWI